MNFVAAIQHATIGYGIRRKAWGPKAFLYLHDGNTLRWGHFDDQVETCDLLGPSRTMDLQASDITGTDWEVI